MTSENDVIIDLMTFYYGNKYGGAQVQKEKQEGHEALKCSPETLEHSTLLYT